MTISHIILHNDFISDGLKKSYEEDTFGKLPGLIESVDSLPATIQVQNLMRERIRKQKFPKRLHKLLSRVSTVSRVTLDKMNRFEETYKDICKPPNENEAYLLFLRDEERHLGLAYPTSEHVPLKEIRNRFWLYAQRKSPDNPYLLYKNLLTSFFKGEHFIFLESEKGKEKAPDTDPKGACKLYETLKPHGYLRGSSHYDHGTLNGATGGPVPTSPDEVPNPQYGLDGNLIKHLCFGRAILLKDTHKTYFGKTEEEVLKETGKAKEAFSRYKITWLQTEGAPDNSSFFTRNFWRHRVRDFTLYFFRKNILHSEKPNVGPYGYGHGDNNPTVIDLRSSATT